MESVSTRSWIAAKQLHYCGTFGLQTGTPSATGMILNCRLDGASGRHCLMMFFISSTILSKKMLWKHAFMNSDDCLCIFHQCHETSWSRSFKRFKDWRSMWNDLVRSCKDCDIMNAALSAEKHLKLLSQAWNPPASKGGDHFNGAKGRLGRHCEHPPHGILHQKREEIFLLSLSVLGWGRNHVQSWWANPSDGLEYRKQLMLTDAEFQSCRKKGLCYHCNEIFGRGTGVSSPSK